MDRINHSLRHCILLFVIVIAITACASRFTQVSSIPTLQQERLGPATGSACGVLLVATPPANFIPISLNSRVARAYRSALSTVPSSTGLIDVTMEDSWYWWILGTTRCTTISGVAVK